MAEYNSSKIIKDGNTYNFRDTTKIPLSGSNQISGNLIPSTDNSIDVGSSTKNIKMLYTKGITINGTQFLPSDYATLSSLSTVATSGSYNDLSNKPTIPSKTSDLTNDSGFITSDNTKIPLAGSNQISGSLIPSTDGTVNLGSVSYQWNNLYAKNYYYNGVAWGLNKQNEWTNIQRMTSNPAVWYLRNNTVTLGTAPLTNRYIGMFFEDVNGADLGYAAFQANKNNYNGIIFSLRNYDGTNVYTGALKFRASTTGDYCFFPENSECDLGISTNKWKTLNGINPGALSLPSSTYISLDTTNFDVTADIIGTFTPTVDGWVVLSISQKNKHFGIWIIGSYRATFHSVYHNSDYMIFALMPVRANVATNIYCTADDIDSTRKIDWLRLFPCQGNV